MSGNDTSSYPRRSEELVQICARAHAHIHNQKKTLNLYQILFIMRLNYTNIPDQQLKETMSESETVHQGNKKAS